MKLSNDTLSVFKNFAAINQNLILKAGNVIKTVSDSATIFAQCTIPDTFPDLGEDGIGIYDLNEFLSVLNLIDDPDLTFEDKYILITSSSGRSRIKYYYQDPDMLTDIPKGIQHPDDIIKFTLDNYTKNRIEKAATLIYKDPLRAEEKAVSISPDKNSLVFTVKDSSTMDNNSASNEIAIDVPGDFDKSKNFNLSLKVEPLKKLLPIDYEVSISSLLISKFKSKDGDLNCEYYLPLDRNNSTYGE